LCLPFQTRGDPGLLAISSFLLEPSLAKKGLICSSRHGLVSIHQAVGSLSWATAHAGQIFTGNIQIQTE